jgi:hypothetical protein
MHDPDVSADLHRIDDPERIGTMRKASSNTPLPNPFSGLAMPGNPPPAMNVSASSTLSRASWGKASKSFRAALIH